MMHDSGTKPSTACPPPIFISASTCRVCNHRPSFSLSSPRYPHFSRIYSGTHQVTLGLGASDRRSICSSGTSCVASSVIVSVAVAAAPAFAAPPPPEEEAAPAAAGGCPPEEFEARSVRDIADPCRPWPALLLPSIFVECVRVRKMAGWWLLQARSRAQKMKTFQEATVCCRLKVLSACMLRRLRIFASPPARAAANKANKPQHQKLTIAWCQLNRLSFIYSHKQ